MKLLSINGYSYEKLKIIDYEISLEPLDAESTGRTKSPGWSLIRSPDGIIFNLKLRFGSYGATSDNPDFIRLYETCKSMGRTDFVKVKFIDPTGATMSQDMYIGPTKWKSIKIQRDGKVYTDVIDISLIAKEGVV